MKKLLNAVSILLLLSPLNSYASGFFSTSLGGGGFGGGYAPSAAQQNAQIVRRMQEEAERKKREEAARKEAERRAVERQQIAEINQKYAEMVRKEKEALPLMEANLRQTEAILEQRFQRGKVDKDAVFERLRKKALDRQSKQTNTVTAQIPSLETDPPITPVTHPGEMVIMAAVPLKAAVDALCFPADTPICTNEKDETPIQTIQVGDYVQSCNTDQNFCECRKVQAVNQRVTNHLLKLTIAGRTLRTTDEHPFYVVTKRAYIPAHKLRRGDALKSLSGKTVFLENIEDEDGEFTVYNLQVDEFENYFAGNVLVHNCNLEAEREKTANLLNTENSGPQPEPPNQKIEQEIPKPDQEVLDSTEGRNILQDLFHIKNQKGLTDIAAGTRKQAEAIGEAWVNGKNVRRFELPGGGYGMTDGTRTFRLQYKPKSGSWKANFQENLVSGTGTVTEIKNVHMPITDM